jgi:anaerobic ribonucleoside-triphosphate reductase activating protein
MMRPVTMLVDQATGDLTVEGMSAVEWLDMAGDLLGAPQPVNCARPLISQHVDISTIRPALAGEHTGEFQAIYYGSVVDGPGRRAVIQMQGCPIRCPGCYVPHTHARGGGWVLPISAVAEAALLPAGGQSDGVTILGGEPFAQPGALFALVLALRQRARGLHLCLYSGYTVWDLLRARGAAGQYARAVLALTDLLIDGPFVARLASGAGEWRGSRNQNIYPGNILRLLVLNALAEEGR